MRAILISGVPGAKQVAHQWRHLDTELRTAMPRIGLWLDSSALSAAETVDRIEAALDTAIIAR